MILPAKRFLRGWHWLAEFHVMVNIASIFSIITGLAYIWRITRREGAKGVVTGYCAKYRGSGPLVFGQTPIYSIELAFVSE